MSDATDPDPRLAYERTTRWAREMLDLRYGCDDNDVARAMLHLMGRPMPVAMLGESAAWFRQLAGEFAGLGRHRGDDLTRCRSAARETVTALPARHAEILRLLGAKSVDGLEDLVTDLLMKVAPNQTMHLRVGDWYDDRHVEIVARDMDIDDIPDDPDPLSLY